VRQSRIDWPSEIRESDIERHSRHGVKLSFWFIRNDRMFQRMKLQWLDPPPPFTPRRGLRRSRRLPGLNFVAVQRSRS
jgi:hypothetical protein